MSKLDFIIGFRKRSGLAILLSTALEKVNAAVLSIVVVRLLSKEDYGYLTYILSIYSIAIVIAGFGGHYSLLRFGSITSSFLIRQEYFLYTLKKGLLYTLVVVFIIAVYSFFIPNNMKAVQPAVFLMSIGVFTFYIKETMGSYFRIINLNRLYSKLHIYNSLILLICVIALTGIMNVYGYVLALGIAPLITFLLFLLKIPRIRYSGNFTVNGYEYWSYGLHTSIGIIATQIIFSIAPLLLGLLNELEIEIANFRVATIIPFNLLTLPGILMIADFNYLSRNYTNSAILKKYYWDYLKVILPIAAVIFILMTIFARPIVVFLFGDRYESCVPMYQILMGATFITYIFRNPLGNILLAVGKAKWNGYNAYAFCILYILFTIAAYPFFGIWTVVYGLCGTFILSGIVSLVYFIHYLRLIKHFDAE